MKTLNHIWILEITLEQKNTFLQIMNKKTFVINKNLNFFFLYKSSSTCVPPSDCGENADFPHLQLGECKKKKKKDFVNTQIYICHVSIVLNKK